MNLRLFLLVSQKRGQEAGHTKSMKDSDAALGLLHQHCLPQFRGLLPHFCIFYQAVEKYMWWWCVPLKAYMIRAQ